MSTAQIPQHTVTYDTRNGEDVATVAVQHRYRGDVDDVWDALTNTERLPRWFAPVSGDLRQGGRYQVEGNAGGTITSCDAPRSFAATWEFGGFTSWLAVDVAADGDDGSTVTIAHTVATDNDHWRQFGPSAVGLGWDLSVYGLAEYLSDTSFDAANEQLWSLSPEGKDFMTACGDAWFTADTAAGAADGEARARVDASIAFFTTMPEEGTGEGAEATA